MRDLLEFLRGCGCEAEQASGHVIDITLQPDVSVEAGMSLVRERRCYGCGAEVARVLAGLGSPLCHDCRDRRQTLGQAWGRMELDEFLRVWCARHPDAGIAVLDGRSAVRGT